MKINAQELMEHCIIQNCETDYNGDIEYTAHLDELLDNDELGYERRTYSWELAKEHLINNAFSDGDKKTYQEYLKELEALEDTDDYEKKEELEHELAEFFTKFDFSDWETEENASLVNFFEDWAKDLEEVLL